MRLPTTKIRNAEKDLRDVCSNLKNLGLKIVLTTGAFDILHHGHLKYLVESRKLADALVVGINSDVSIKKIKGDERPIIGEEKRQFLISGFECVDFVCIFDSDDEIADIVRPDILVMSQTSENKMEERRSQVEIVESHGGEIVLFPPMSEIHTTDLIKKITSG